MEKGLKTTEKDDRVQRLNKAELEKKFDNKI